VDVQLYNNQWGEEIFLTWEGTVWKEGLGRKLIEYNLLCNWQRFSLIN